MSDTSPSTEPSWLPRALRVAGVATLLAIQGGCGLIVARLHRAATSVAAPSREARHAAAIRAVGTPDGLEFPSILGYVDRFDDDLVAVMTPEGRRHVRVDGLTVFRTPDRLAAPSDLRPGSGVIVYGDPDAAGRVLADVVMVRPAP